MHAFRKIKSKNRKNTPFFAFLQAESAKYLEVPENSSKFALSINRNTDQRSGTKGSVSSWPPRWPEMTKDVARDGQGCGPR